MANPNNPFGFRAYETLAAAGYTAKTILGYVPSADTNGYWEGDTVQLRNTGDSTGVLGVNAITAGNEGTAVPLGVVSSIVAGQNPSLNNFQGVPLTLENIPVPATKVIPYYLNIIGISADTIFELQDDGLNALDATAVGKNCSYTAANGASTQLGFSGFLLKTSSVNTTSTLPLTIIGVSPRTPTVYAAYTVWLVKFNTMQFLQQNAGI